MANEVDFNNLDDDAFDAYIVNEGFQKIQCVAEMENFLLRSVRRFHILDAELSAAINANQTLPVVKQEAWEFGRYNFCAQYSDLRMFFSETDDYHEQSPEERKRLNAVADALVCSGRDPSKIEQVQQLRKQGAVTPKLAQFTGSAPADDDIEPTVGKGRGKGAWKPRDLYQEVTDKIVEAIENGTAPWQRPWDATSTWPVNGVTGKPYHGINVMLLAGEGFQDGRWCSYKMAKEKGWQVRRDEHGTRIYFYKMLQRPSKDIDPGTGEPEVKMIPILKSYTVFNLRQMDNVPELERNPAHGHTQMLSDVMQQICDEIVEATGAEIVHGYRSAYYDVKQDKIFMPDRESFSSDAAYYATLMHEVSHWSGSADRLNRTFSFDRDDPQYAREELRAEMASAMLSMRLGLPAAIGNHSAYVDHYLQILRNDNREIFRAAKDAEKISRYVLSFHPDFRDEFEQEHVDQAKSALDAGAPEEVFDATDFDFEPDMPMMGMRRP